MSTFQCAAVRVTVEPHPNADAIELARVGGYLCVVRKGQFQTGDLAVYIPEQSVIPEWLLKLLGFWDDMNAKGKLSGGSGNRVRAMKLRGVLSQGLLMGFAYDNPEVIAYLPSPGEHPELGVGYDMTAFPALQEGNDFADYLGIVKYEPVVPVHMTGRAIGGDLGATIGYDFENIKKFPALFSDGEKVVMTEKIHGTFVQVGLIPEAVFAGKVWAEQIQNLGGTAFKPVVTSKGQGARGILLDTDDETNLYVKTVTKLGLWESLYCMRKQLGVPDDKPIFLCGEIFGPGVQTNFAYGQSAPIFQAFDIYVGTRSDGFFLDYALMRDLCETANVQIVPLLFSGAFSQETLDFHTAGNTHVHHPGMKPQIREGLVVKSMREARHPVFGRKIAKSISEQYLLKGKTSEFQ